MAAKKIGDVLKKARTDAGLSQAALAQQVDGLSASDIGRAERGEKQLTKEQLRQIAKATGVTQKSLLEAAGTSGKTSSSGKTGTSGKTSSSGKTGTSGKTSSSGKTGSSGKTSSSGKTAASSAAGLTMKVTAAEKTLLQQYRKADAETQKAVKELLAEKKNDISGILQSLLGNALGMLGKK